MNGFSGQRNKAASTLPSLSAQLVILGFPVCVLGYTFQEPSVIPLLFRHKIPTPNMVWVTLIELSSVHFCGFISPSFLASSLVILIKWPCTVQCICFTCLCPPINPLPFNCWNSWASTQKSPQLDLACLVKTPFCFTCGYLDRHKYMVRTLVA